MGEKRFFFLITYYLIRVPLAFGTQGSSPEIIRLANILGTSQNNKVVPAITTFPQLEELDPAHQ